MQTHVSPEDLMLSFQSSNEYFGNISLQKSASIQPRTSGSKLLIHTYQYTPQVINTALVSPVDTPLGPGGRCTPLSDWTRSHRAPLATPSAYPPHPRARSAADRKAPCMRIAQAGLEPTICPIFVNTPQSVEMVDSYSTIPALIFAAKVKQSCTSSVGSEEKNNNGSARIQMLSSLK